MENNSAQSSHDRCNFNITQRGTYFFGSISVAPSLLCFIIGRHGHTKQTIQNDTGTTITIPRSWTKDQVVVDGRSEAAVANALSKIVGLMNYGKKRLRLTHFISVSTHNDAMKTSLELLKAKILASCSGERAYDVDLFQMAHKFHLTLSKMVLCDDDAIKGAVKSIERFQLDNAILFERPLRIRIKGIDFLGQNASVARELFAKVDNSLDRDRLLDLAIKLEDFLFNEQIIVEKHTERINLHMTIMGVWYLKLDKRIRSFDCSDIMSEYADWDFGLCDIDTIYLSQRYSANKDHYYINDASFTFGQG